ncbi:MAG: TPM domain-containing protein [Candidatus Margulisiibacteriota bacterium]|nr:TPM domain-containing protein [Candidatus Margulisiibacteriota bacterium]
MFKRPLIILLLGFFFAGVVFADAKFPSYSGYINDFAGVLSASQKQELGSLSRSLKQKTGAELAVAIVKSVEPLGPKLYAVKLFEKWGIGEKGEDNGILIFLAMKERRVEIEVGYGLEGVLPDAKTGEILDNYAVPYFKQGKMGEGVLRTARVIARVAAGEDIETAAKSSDAFSDWLILLVIFCFIGLIIFLSIKHGGKGSRGGWSSGGWSSGRGSSFGGGSSGGGGAGRSW